MEYCCICYNCNLVGVVMSKQIIYGVIILVIAMSVYGYLFNPEVKDKINDVVGSVKDNIVLSQKTNNTNPSVSKCIQSFNSCKQISTKKYDWSLSILEIEEFDDIQEAEEFYNIWHGLYEFRSYFREYDLPYVLIAVKIISPNGQVPTVVVCQDGELSPAAKSKFSCGKAI
ncbi:hypothetical protein LCGC14_0374680 [marine sediment metagenome]|uniref:Uncharacterized protein n=1 Tax=marine sediment metagenome TaxID=412755 RepID=A0A0F9WCZ2_9ZZZZ